MAGVPGTGVLPPLSEDDRRSSFANSSGAEVSPARKPQHAARTSASQLVPVPGVEGEAGVAMASVKQRLTGWEECCTFADLEFLAMRIEWDRLQCSAARCCRDFYCRL